MFYFILVVKQIAIKASFHAVKFGLIWHARYVLLYPLFITLKTHFWHLKLKMTQEQKKQKKKKDISTHCHFSSNTSNLHRQHQQPSWQQQHRTIFHCPRLQGSKPKPTPLQQLHSSPRYHHRLPFTTLSFIVQAITNTTTTTLHHATTINYLSQHHLLWHNYDNNSLNLKKKKKGNREKHDQ